MDRSSTIGSVTRKSAIAHQRLEHQWMCHKNSQNGRPMSRLRILVSVCERFKSCLEM